MPRDCLTALKESRHRLQLVKLKQRELFDQANYRRRYQEQHQHQHQHQQQQQHEHEQKQQPCASSSSSSSSSAAAASSSLRSARQQETRHFPQHVRFASTLTEDEQDPQSASSSFAAVAPAAPAAPAVPATSTAETPSPVPPTPPAGSGAGLPQGPAQAEAEEDLSINPTLASDSSINKGSRGGTGTGTGSISPYAAPAVLLPRTALTQQQNQQHQQQQQQQQQPGAAVLPTAGRLLRSGFVPSWGRRVTPGRGDALPLAPAPAPAPELPPPLLSPETLSLASLRRLFMNHRRAVGTNASARARSPVKTEAPSHAPSHAPDRAARAQERVGPYEGKGKGEALVEIALAAAEALAAEALARAGQPPPSPLLSPSSPSPPLQAQQPVPLSPPLSPSQAQQLLAPSSLAPHSQVQVQVLGRQLLLTSASPSSSSSHLVDAQAANSITIPSIAGSLKEEAEEDTNGRVAAQKAKRLECVKQLQIAVSMAEWNVGFSFR